MLKPKKKDGEKHREYSISWKPFVHDPVNHPNDRTWHLGVNERAIDIASFAFNPELNLSLEHEATIVNNMTLHFIENINLDAVMGILYHSTTH